MIVMSGLILKLRPFESIMINGAIVENGDRKTKLRIASDKVNVLRLRDSLSPEDATTPLKQAYYLSQQTVAGHIAPLEARDMIQAALDALSGEGLGNELNQAREELNGECYYGVMRELRRLVREREATGDSNDAHPASAVGAK